MDELSRLKSPAGAKRTPKRVGRGNASGWGKTCGRGHKGLKSRSGGSPPPGYEGGQMPLIRRLPKRGFNSKFRKEYTLISLRDLGRFEAGSVVDLKAMVQSGLVRSVRNAGIKIVANGEIGIPLTVQADRFTKAAREKIEAAGGKVEEI